MSTDTRWETAVLERISNNGERVAVLETKLDTVIQDVSEIKQNLTTLTSNMAKLTENVNQLTQKVDGVIARVDKIEPPIEKAIAILNKIWMAIKVGGTSILLGVLGNFAYNVLF